MTLTPFSCIVTLFLCTFCLLLEELQESFRSNFTTLSSVQSLYFHGDSPYLMVNLGPPIADRCL